MASPILDLDARPFRNGTYGNYLAHQTASRRNGARGPADLRRRALILVAANDDLYCQRYETLAKGRPSTREEERTVAAAPEGRRLVVEAKVGLLFLGPVASVAPRLKDRPDIYLFHRHWLWAYTNKLSGLRTIPDGLVRVQGLKMN